VIVSVVVPDASVRVVKNVAVDVDVTTVATQFGFLVTSAQLGAATTEPAEIAIAAAKMAATVRSTSIRFTLIHPPFLYSFYPPISRSDPLVLPPFPKGRD
jgi:hypothetical protein